MKDTMKDTIKDTMKDTVKEMNKIDLEQVTGGCIPIPSIPGIPYVSLPLSPLHFFRYSIHGITGRG